MRVRVGCRHDARREDNDAVQSSCVDTGVGGRRRCHRRHHSGDDRARRERCRDRAAGQAARAADADRRRRHGGRRPYRRPHSVLQLRHGRRRAQAAGHLGLAVQPGLGRQGVFRDPVGAGGQARRGRARRSRRQIRDRARPRRRHPQGHARGAREPHLRAAPHAAAIRAVAPRAVHAARLHPLSRCLEGGRRAPAGQAGHLFQFRLPAAAAGAAAPLRHPVREAPEPNVCWRRSA